MTAHEVDLELLQFVGGNVNVGQLSETGADTVNDGALCNDLLDHAARSIDRLLAPRLRSRRVHARVRRGRFPREVSDGR